MKKLIGSLLVFGFLLVSSGVWAQGAIDNSTIGLTTPQAGKFTNLEATTQITLGAETITNFSGLDDDKVKVSAGDTADFLESQIVGGTGVTVNSDGSQITISAPPVNVEDSADGVEITFANEFDTPSGSGNNLAIDINGTDLFQGTTDPTVTVGGVPYDIQAKGLLSTGQQVIVTPPSGTGRAAGHHKLKLSNANGFSEGLILLDEVISGIGGNDAFTKLLLHFDGNFNDVANGATNPPHTVTPVNGATQQTPDTNNPASPAGGNFASFDGTDDYLSIPDSDDFEFGASEDFTVEFWAYPTSVTSSARVLNKGSSVSPYLIFQNGANWQFYASSGVGWDVAFTISLGTVDVDAWQHLAVTRQGDTFRLFKDGVQQSSFTSTLSLYDNSSPVTVGSSGNGEYYEGHLDEVRLSKGIARWTADFTPPAAPYN